MAPKQAAPAAKKTGGLKRKYTKKATRVTKAKRSAATFTSLRKSITPGTIGIMLAGRFRGRRVVIVKQLPKNGPLVITGPFKMNGVPLRRVDARYLIATSTKVDLKGVDASKITPEVFKRAKAVRAKKGEADFMGDKAKRAAERKARKSAKAGGKKEAKKATKVSDERKALQKTIDDAIIASLKKDALGNEKIGYLHSVFTIKSGDCPHRMKF